MKIQHLDMKYAVYRIEQKLYLSDDEATAGRTLINKMPTNLNLLYPYFPI